MDSGGSDGESSDENADPARRKSRSEGASKFKDKDEQYIDKLVELKHILEIIIKRKEIVKYVENDIFDRVYRHLCNWLSHGYLRIVVRDRVLGLCCRVSGRYLLDPETKLWEVVGRETLT